MSACSAGWSQPGNRQVTSRQRTNWASAAEGRYPGSASVEGSTSGLIVAAAAIVKVLDQPKTQVSVPGNGRFIAIAAQLLPDRGRRWLNTTTGNDTVFLNLNTGVRRAYEDRAQHATGVEHKD